MCRLTSDYKFHRLTCEGVLCVEVTGGDLTFPVAIIKLQLSSSYPYWTVSGLLRTRPLIFVHVHSNRLQQKEIPTFIVLNSIYVSSISKAAVRTATKSTFYGYIFTLHFFQCFSKYVFLYIHITYTARILYSKCNKKVVKMMLENYQVYSRLH